MKTYLTKKYRLIWNIDSSIIQNNYQSDYSGSTTILVINPDEADFIESDIYQDIIDKIDQNSLIESSED